MGTSKASPMTEQEDVVGGEGSGELLQTSLGAHRAICACHFKGLVPLSSSAIIRKVNNVVSKGEENTEKTVEG